MPDRVAHPEQGPDRMWSTDLPPSRGQLHTIATLALRLLEVDPPAHRLDASIVITRLHQAVRGPNGPTVPAIEADF